MSFNFKHFLPAALALACFAAANTASAQFYKFHSADVGVAATGQFTTSITNQDVSQQGAPLPHQATTTSPGVLVTLRDHPFSWAGIELNYQYTKFSERYVLEPGNRPEFHETNMHEATGAYLFHLHMHRLAPYVGIGGGAVDFTLTDHQPNYNNQWRAAGLVDVGFDMQTKSRLGFRVGARDLVYRAPDYRNPGLSSSRWVSTEEPYAGVYVKF